MAYRLGVDVGGTFTDLFLVDDADDRQWRVKTPSTPADPSQGVLAGVARICAEAGIAPPSSRNVVHGTTVATNAVLECKGARVGLITTRGLRADPAPRALADARARWPAGSSWSSPTRRPRWRTRARPSSGWTRAANTLVARRPRAGRRAIVDDLVGSGVESLTVSLINSYVDGAPRAARSPTIVEELLPGLPGHDLAPHVLPEFREYERTLTACMNSYVRPHGRRLRGPPAAALQRLGVTTERRHPALATRA